MAILARSTITRGLPSRFPFARAFRKPARTRSAIRLRSNSATAPKTVKTMRPAGVAVSSDADRPTNSIPRTRNVSLLMRLKEKRNLALLFITHNPALLPGLAERVLVMYAGRVVEQGPLEPVYKDPLHPYTKALLRLVPRSPMRGATGRKEKWPAIPGEPCDAEHMPSGCRFEPRCDERLAACSQAEPEMVNCGGSRVVRCIHYVR